MAEESDEPAEGIAFIMPDEQQLDFQEKFTELLVGTKELGLVIHLCLVAQTMGRQCMINAPQMMGILEKNMVMNFHHGAQGVIHELLEASAEGKPN